VLNLPQQLQRSVNLVKIQWIAIVIFLWAEVAKPKFIPVDSAKILNVL
jgi:hypothetical protein